MVRFAFFFYGFLLLLAAGITFLFGEWSHWFPAKNWKGVGLDALIAVATAATFVGVSRILSAQFEAFRRVTSEFHHFFQGMSLRDVWLLALLSGVAEEALFRAALQPLIGLVAASVLFGLLHIKPENSPDMPQNPLSTQEPFEENVSVHSSETDTGETFHASNESQPHDNPPVKKPNMLWAWTVFALLFGFVIGALFQWRQGLFLPALTHVLINGFNLTWLSRTQPT